MLTTEQLEFLTSIQSLSDFMLQLVNDLLDVSKIEAGKLQLHVEEVDLSNLAKEQVALNRPLATKKRITLTLRPCDAPLVLSLDPGKIEQVLVNLLTNAIKFSPPDTTIVVLVSRHGNEAWLSVCDQGPGIPAAELATLFQPFQLSSVKSTAGEHSTGLGLVIVRRIVEGHHGRIWVESVVGQGSAFHVALPIEPGAPPPGAIC